MILILSSFVSSISIASAESVERNFILNSEGSQSFDVLMQEAQALAQSAIEQEFIENSEATEVSILILGEHQGQIVPLLQSQVSRSRWQQDPKIHRWTRYFAHHSRVLLGFNKPSAFSKPQLDSPQERRRRIENDPAYRDD